MSYPSVDKLQASLANTVFAHTKDRKKAAGRALGTLVEIITYYTLRAWGFRDSTAIERRLEEYKNPIVTHNVEYSLHPILAETEIISAESKLPISISRLKQLIPDEIACEADIYGNPSSSTLPNTRSGTPACFPRIPTALRSSPTSTHGERMKFESPFLVFTPNHTRSSSASALAWRKG